MTEQWSCPNCREIKAENERLRAILTPLTEAFLGTSADIVKFDVLYGSVYATNLDGDRWEWAATDTYADAEFIVAAADAAKGLLYAAAKGGFLAKGGRAMSEQYADHERGAMARFLRLGVVRNLLGQGILSRADAVELLQGPLSPGDPASVVDDSGLLDASLSEVKAVLGIQETASASNGDQSAIEKG